MNITQKRTHRRWPLLYLILYVCAAHGMQAQILPADSTKDDEVATHAAAGVKKFNLDEVVVTATRTPKRLMQTPVITQVITAAQIEDRGLTDIRNLLTQEIPGLAFNEVGFGTSINLQGLGGKHILFLIDGERMAGETGNNVDIGGGESGANGDGEVRVVGEVGVLGPRKLNGRAVQMIEALVVTGIAQMEERPSQDRHEH